VSAGRGKTALRWCGGSVAGLSLSLWFVRWGEFRKADCVLNSQEIARH
jgi:hypothetical protein